MRTSPGESEQPRPRSVESVPDSAWPTLNADASSQMRAFYGTVRRSFAGGEEWHDTESADAAQDFLRDVQERMGKLVQETPAGGEQPRPEAYAEGMAMLADHVARAEHNRIEGYDQYPDDVRTEIQGKDQRVRGLFRKAGGRLFPGDTARSTEVQPTPVLRELNGLVRQAGDNLALEKMDLEHLQEAAADPKELLRRIERIMIAIGERLATRAETAVRRANDSTEHEAGFSKSEQQAAVLAERVLYRLKLWRGLLTQNLYERDGLTRSEMERIDALRRNPHDLRTGLKWILNGVKAGAGPARTHDRWHVHSLHNSADEGRIARRDAPGFISRGDCLWILVRRHRRRAGIPMDHRWCTWDRHCRNFVPNDGRPKTSGRHVCHQPSSAANRLRRAVNPIGRDRDRRCAR